MTAQQLVQELEIRNQQLAALHEAAMAIAGEVALTKVLQQIVNSACKLVGARYAALGVPTAEGYLETFIHSGLTPAEVSRIPHQPKGLGLLGALIHEQRPIRLPRISDDSRSVGFPEGHPPMESFLGVPIVAGDRSLGNLYLTNKIGGEAFTAADQEVVEMLAAHAAIAIQNARLYEQVGRLAVLEERTRIGMDLHDGIIQSIYAVGLTLESARLTLEEDVAEADVLLERAVETLNETIRDIRNFILDLRPQRFQGSLDEGLARLVREFQANTMVLVKLEAPPETVLSLPTGVARALFLTTQEALANVARHARANQVKISLDRQETGVLLTIEDDGRGFEAAALRQAVGHGLANMRSRADELGGRFTIHTELGQGTTLQLKLPLPH